MSLFTTITMHFCLLFSKQIVSFKQNKVNDDKVHQLFLSSNLHTCLELSLQSKQNHFPSGTCQMRGRKGNLDFSWFEPAIPDDWWGSNHTSIGDLAPTTLRPLMICVAWGWMWKCKTCTTRIKCLRKNPKHLTLTHTTHALPQSQCKSLEPLILKNITCDLSLDSFVLILVLCILITSVVLRPCKWFDTLGVIYKGLFGIHS